LQSFQKAQKLSSINLLEGNIAALQEIGAITTMYKKDTNLLFKITLQMSVGKHFFWPMELQCYIKKKLKEIIFSPCHITELFLASEGIS